MSQRNSAASWVDVLRAQTEDLSIGLDDGGKGFVEFPDGNVRF